MDEVFRVSGIEVRVTEAGEVWFGAERLGRVGRELRFDQWFWRAYEAETGEALRRFHTTRLEAIQLLLIRAELIEGIGY